MMLPRREYDWESQWWLPEGACTGCGGCGELDASRLPIAYTPPGIYQGKHFALAYECRACAGTGRDHGGSCRETTSKEAA